MPIFKFLICRIDIEILRELFIKRKGSLLYSWCLDKFLKKKASINWVKIMKSKFQKFISLYLKKE